MIGLLGLDELEIGGLYLRREDKSLHAFQHGVFQHFAWNGLQVTIPAAFGAGASVSLVVCAQTLLRSQTVKRRATAGAMGQSREQIARIDPAWMVAAWIGQVAMGGVLLVT